MSVLEVAHLNNEVLRDAVVEKRTRMEISQQEFESQFVGLAYWQICKTFFYIWKSLLF